MRSRLHLSQWVYGMVIALVTCLTAIAGYAAQAQGELLRRSGDAYVRQVGTRWIFGTDKVEKEIIFASGHLSLSSFKDGITHHEYVQGPSDVFRFELNGQMVTGHSQPWGLDGAQTQILGQGELR